MSSTNQLAEQNELTPIDRSMIDVQSSRAVAEVQGAMAIAKRFPRDENAAFDKIMKACSRKSLAEVAIYEYPRGGQKVSGPSIRLAEAIAQSWGNIATGVIELERKEGESLALAYCVDLETNYRKDVTFAVPHIVDTKQGPKHLTETRDVYEIVMNMGSRRLRNCIMAVIPGDIFEAAEAECMKTLTSDKQPISDQIREAISAFSPFGVTAEMLGAKFGCKVEALSPQQIAKLRTIHQSIRDGVGTPKDFFGDPSAPKAQNNTGTGSAPKTNPRSALGADIVTYGKKLDLDTKQIGEWAMEVSGKPLKDMTIEDMEKFLVTIKEECGRNGIFV